VRWPDGHIPVAVVHGSVLLEADPALTLAVGDRVSLLSKRRGDDAGTHADAPLVAEPAGSA
jgi:hypothetical protein